MNVEHGLKNRARFLSGLFSILHSISCTMFSAANANHSEMPSCHLSYYIDISPKYSLNIPKTAVLSIRGLGPGA
jgi:hypothetical protein